MLFGGQLHLLLLMRPGLGPSRSRSPEIGKKKREKKKKRRWRGTEIAPNGTRRAQGFLEMEFCCHYYRSQLLHIGRTNKRLPWTD